MNLLWLSCLLVSTVLVNGNILTEQVTSPRYLLTYPQTLSPTSNQICLTFLNGYVPRNSILEVTLTHPRTEDRLTSQRFELESASQCVNLPTEDIRERLVNLKMVVENVVDVSKLVRFLPSIGMTLIETSKPVYQPGETLKFRALGFDGWMKPWDESFTHVAIYNPRGFKVMEWKGVQLRKGLEHFQLPLALYNDEGIWKIVGVTKSGETIEKTFRVSRHVTPEVVLKVTHGNKYILSTEESHRFAICAEDKFGAALVDGSVAATFYLNVPSRQPYQIFKGEVDAEGCAHFEALNSTLGWTNNVNQVYYLQATYTNSETNEVGQISLGLPVVRSGVVLRVPSTKFVKNYFKPGLPYFGYLMVEQPDYTPLQKAQVSICYLPLRQPWNTVGARKQCKQFTSQNDGTIQFIIPPVPQETRQVLIEAIVSGVAEHKQIFVLSPWSEQTTGQFLIRPIVRQSECSPTERSVKTQIFMTRNGTKNFEQLYVQQAGRVAAKATKAFTVRPAPWIPETQLMIGEWPAECEVYADTIRAEPQPIQLSGADQSYSPLNRVIIYGLDTQGRLISDSIAYLKDCLRDESLLEVEADEKNKLALKLHVTDGSPCSVTFGTDAERGMITERKIHKLLEKFDEIHAKSWEWDQCSLAKKQRTSEPSPLFYSAPLIFNYQNDWDTFKDMGLYAHDSARDLFEKKCEWDVLDEATRNSSLYSYLALRPYLAYDSDYMRSLADQAEYARLVNKESELVNDLFDWNVIHSGNLETVHETIRPSQLNGIPTVHVHAICMDSKRGLRTVSIKKELRQQPFLMEHDLPEAISESSERKVNIYIKRHEAEIKKQFCLPIHLTMEPIENSFQVISQPGSICACGKVTKVQGHLKSLKQGPLNIKLVGKFADEIAEQCNKQAPQFEQQTTILTTQTETVIPKIVKKSFDLMCQKAKKSMVLKSGEKVHVAYDLANVILRQYKEQAPIRRNILQVVAQYSPLVDLYSTYERKWPETLRTQVSSTLKQLYQELAMFKLPDGSYSMFPGTQRVSSLPATVFVYSALSQAYEKFGHGYSDELMSTFDWINSQNVKNCFRLKHYNYMPYSNWPFNHTEVSELESTAFVAATLAQTKHSRMFLRRSLKCIEPLRQTQSMDQMTQAMVALIYAKLDKKTVAQETLDTLASQWGLDRQIPGRFDYGLWENQGHSWDAEETKAKAYYVLAKIVLGQTEGLHQIARQLVASEASLNEPIVAHALAKVWGKIQEEESISFIAGSRPINISPYEMTEVEFNSEPSQWVESSGKGCTILRKSFPFDTKASLWEEDRTEEDNLGRRVLTVKNLKKGYKSCANRVISICAPVNVNSHESPIYKLRLPTRYQLDTEMLDRMIYGRRSLVDYYRVDGLDVYLAQGRVARLNESCLEIPLKQVQTISTESDLDAEIYIHRYNSADLSESPRAGYIKITPKCELVVTRHRRATESSASAASNNLSTRSTPEKRNYEQQQEAYEAPVKGGYSSPAYETPSYPTPSYEPAKGYASPPAYQAPSYPAPSYPAPSYPAPSYPAPSYPAPSYPAPSYPTQDYEPYPAPMYEQQSYQTPMYEQAPYNPPVKGYSPPPSYEPAYQAPAYEPAPYSPPPPAYQPPPYEPAQYSPPAKGYASPPAYQPPSYPTPSYPAPAYEPMPYQAPMYEQAPYNPPVKGYSPPPSYEPAYQAPAYEPAPYSPPAKGYEASYTPPAYSPPSYSPPAYSPPAYSPPAYEPAPYSPPAKGYEAPAYAPPAYPAPAYEPPSYQPAYEQTYAPAPIYPAPAYPAPSYPAPSYEPTYQTPSYSPPAYEAPAYEPAAPAYPAPAYPAPSYPAPSYPAPAYEPQKGYAPPPVYDAPAYAPYRNAQGRNAASRFGQSQSAGQSSSNLAARKPAQNMNASAARGQANMQAARQAQNQRLYNRRAQQSQRNANGLALFSASRAQATEMMPTYTKKECEMKQIAQSCPRCQSRLSVDNIDELCNKPVTLALLKVHKMVNDQVTCGAFDIAYDYSQRNQTATLNEPFTIPENCECDQMKFSSVVIVSDLLSESQSGNEIARGKAFGKETLIIPATQNNLQEITTYHGLCV